MIAFAIHVDGDVHQNATHVVHNHADQVAHHADQVAHHARQAVRLVQHHAAQHHVASLDAQLTHQTAARSLAARHALRSVRQDAHLVVHNWCVERPQVEMYSGSED